MIKFATIFSGGLGGIEFGLKYENIDSKCVFGAEIDKYARKQYLEFHDEPTDMFYQTKP